MIENSSPPGPQSPSLLICPKMLAKWVFLFHKMPCHAIIGFSMLLQLQRLPAQGKGKAITCPRWKAGGSTFKGWRSTPHSYHSSSQQWHSSSSVSYSSSSGAPWISMTSGQRQWAPSSSRLAWIHAFASSRESKRVAFFESPPAGISSSRASMNSS